MKIKKIKTSLVALDLKYCVYLNQFSHTQSIAYFFKVISRLGDGTFWLFMLAILWFLQGVEYGFQVIYLILSSFIGTFFYTLLKNKTLRPRPYQVHQVMRLGERPLDHFSFPSGHTLHAVMLTTILGYIQPVLLIIMTPFSIFVALSRMILGLHYPSDVIVGAILGALLAIATISAAPFMQIYL